MRKRDVPSNSKSVDVILLQPSSVLVVQILLTLQCHHQGRLVGRIAMAVKSYRVLFFLKMDICIARKRASGNRK